MEHLHNNNFTYSFCVEPDYKTQPLGEWFKECWSNTFHYSAIYLLFIYVGTKWMENRERYSLRSLLVAWNLCLAFFSIIGTIRLFEEAYDLMTKGGFQLVCSSQRIYSGVSSFWSLAFVLSKLMELGDTAFIVFRKQNLIFLHWYHHITVMIFTWHSYAYCQPQGRVYTLMNFFVHAIMYSYYALRAMQVRVPKSVNIGITSLQIAQMVAGLLTTVYVWYLKSIGAPGMEYVLKNNLIACFLMYVSYFVLFKQFFYQTYVNKSTLKSPKAEAKVSTTSITQPRKITHETMPRHRVTSKSYVKKEDLLQREYRFDLSVPLPVNL